MLTKEVVVAFAAASFCFGGSKQPYHHEQQNHLAARQRAVGSRLKLI